MRGATRTPSIATRAPVPVATPIAPARPFTVLSRNSTLQPDNRQSTPLATTYRPVTGSTITCFTCRQPSHLSKDCPKRRVDLKEIEEELLSDNEVEELGPGNDLA